MGVTWESGGAWVIRSLECRGEGGVEGRGNRREVGEVGVGGGGGGEREGNRKRRGGGGGGWISQQKQWRRDWNP